MKARDAIRLRAHDGKSEVQLDWTPEARGLHWEKQQQLLKSFSHKDLLPLAQKAFEVAKETGYPLNSYAFFIPGEANGEPFSPKLAVEALKSGRVLSCARDSVCKKPKLTFGDKDWKPATKKKSVLRDISW